jgi:hypothetical protein
MIDLFLVFPRFAAFFGFLGFAALFLGFGRGCRRRRPHLTLALARHLERILELKRGVLRALLFKNFRNKIGPGSHFIY